MKTNELIELVRYWLNESDKSDDAVIFQLLTSGYKSNEFDESAVHAYIIPQLKLEDVEGLIRRYGSTAGEWEKRPSLYAWVRWAEGGVGGQVNEYARLGCVNRAAKQVAQEAMVVISSHSQRPQADEVLVFNATSLFQNLDVLADIRSHHSSFEELRERMRRSVDDLSTGIRGLTGQTYHGRERFEFLLLAAAARATFMARLVRLGWDAPAEVTGWAPGALCHTK